MNFVVVLVPLCKMTVLTISNFFYWFIISKSLKKKKMIVVSEDDDANEATPIAYAGIHGLCSYYCCRGWQHR